MSTGGQFRLRHRVCAPPDAPPAEATRLVPVLVRAIELGRGPPGLLHWLAGWLPPAPGGRPPPDAVARLAAELTRILRRVGVTETVVE
jgi:hypothetical protein